MFWLQLYLICTLVVTTYFSFADKLQCQHIRSFHNAIDNGKFAKIISYLLIALLLLEGVLSIFFAEDIQYDAEVGSLVVSWIHSQGQDMYQSLNGDSVYSLLYGPYMFLPASATFYLGGGQYELRALSLIAVLIYIFFLFSLTNKSSNRDFSRLWAIAVTFLALYIVFTSRMDAWLLALPMFAAFCLSKNRFIIAACCAGFACGIKITAVLYFAPLFILAWTDVKPTCRQFLATAAVFCGVSLLPFLVSGISLENYAFWVSAANSHAKRTSQIFINLGIFILIAFPSITIDKFEFRKRRHFQVIMTQLSIWSCAILMAYFASKEGASFYHMVPFSAVVTLLLMKNDILMTTERKSLILLFSLTVPFAFILHTQYLRLIVDSDNPKVSSKFNADVKRDIDELLSQKKTRGDYAIGAGLGKARSNADLYVLMKGGSYLINDVAMWDWHASSLKVPTLAVDRLKRCDVSAWLIPHGESPFHSESNYRKHEYTMEELRSIFNGSYSLMQTGKYYDLWECNVTKE
jgi:hypothetical protein